MLAARFGDEIVLLDEETARLLWLDAAAARVWGVCRGVSTAAVAAATGEAPGRVAEMLQALLDAGLVMRDGTAWTRADTEWI